MAARVTDSMVHARLRELGIRPDDVTYSDIQGAWEDCRTALHGDDSWQRFNAMGVRGMGLLRNGLRDERLERISDGYVEGK